MNKNIISKKNFFIRFFSHFSPYTLHPTPYTLKKGQVLFPTLLVIPMLMLFIFLLFETTKLSREKIRQQFAVDSAAFIQMGDYTNLFNRTAYVNGVFPYRIFKEGYPCPGPSVVKSDDNQAVCLYDVLYENGMFPRRFGDTGNRFTDNEDRDLDNQKKWEIKFFTNKPSDSNSRAKETILAYFIGDNKESPDYDPRRGGPESDIRMNDAKPSHSSLCKESSSCSGPLVFRTGSYKKGWKPYFYFDSWKDVYNTGYFYVTVYNLLGQIASSQISVFEKLTDGYRFFRKSYYLNAGCEDESTCGNDGVRFFKKPKIDKYVVKQFKIFFTIAPNRPNCPCKITLAGTICHPCDGSYDESDYKTFDTSKGLFQLATVDTAHLKSIQKGFEVYQGWEAPGNNFFNVDFTQERISDGCEGIEAGRACVHARVASQCPADDNNCVWPNPTSKYQTRLYP